MSVITPSQAGSLNVCAFLDMIAHSEGTDRYGNQGGYDVVVGGSLFVGYSDHPRKLVRLSDTLSSTAAGRYQLLARYFDAYKKQLGLADFSPLSQDLIAIQQIRERRALPLIVSGDFAGAVQAVSNIWASMPGAGYGQRENKLSVLAAAFEAAGGVIV